MDTKKTAKDRWEEAYAEKDEREVEFSTMSGVPVKPLYTPEDVEGSFERRSGTPASIRIRAGSTRACIGVGCGP